MAILTLEQLLERTHDLASLPEVVMRAVDMINDPDSSAGEIGKVISEDVGLTTRLLRVVNSSFYGFQATIDTVSRAITVIGMMELLDLILATSVVKAFAGVPNKLINMDDFWHHSLYTGIVARGLASHQQAPNTERYFVSGLVHNVGSLLLYRHMPEESMRIMDRVKNSQEFLHRAEKEVFGYDHAEVGAALLANWHLPDSIIESTACHHRPMEARTYRLETATVHLADIITSAVEKKTVEPGEVPPFDPAAWELTGLSASIMADLVEEADEQFLESQEFLIPRATAA